MDFKDQIAGIMERSKNAATTALTEEATKHSVILPFIQTLGFDPFSLDDVIPELTADVGVKKGEKIDYALCINKKVQILIEVKSIHTNLSKSHISQLYRYFGCTDAKIAVLTNGREFWFYSDLEEPNKMDPKPFFIFNFATYTDACVKTLATFRKDEFDIEKIIGNATRTIRAKLIAETLHGLVEHPTDEFVKMVAKGSHQGAFTRSALEELTPIVKAALADIVKQKIREMLDINEMQAKADAAITVEDDCAEAEGTTVLTQDEIDAYNVIRAICSRVVPASRIVLRDTKSYCGVFLDDNRNKTLCRLYVNSASTKRIWVFTGERDEKTGACLFERISVDFMSETFDFEDKILAALNAHLNEGVKDLGENVVSINRARA